MPVISNLRSGFILPNGEILIGSAIYEDGKGHVELVDSFFEDNIMSNLYMNNMFRRYLDVRKIYRDYYAIESFIIQVIGCIKVGAPTDNFYRVSIAYPFIPNDTKNQLTYNFVQNIMEKYKMYQGNARGENSDRLAYYIAPPLGYWGDTIEYEEQKGYPFCKK